MLETSRRRRNWPVLLLAVDELREEEAEMEEPLKKADVFAVEDMRRGVAFNIGE